MYQTHKENTQIALYLWVITFSSLAKFFLSINIYLLPYIILRLCNDPISMRYDKFVWYFIWTSPMLFLTNLSYITGVWWLQAIKIWYERICIIMLGKNFGTGHEPITVSYNRIYWFSLCVSCVTLLAILFTTKLTLKIA